MTVRYDKINERQYMAFIGTENIGGITLIDGDKAAVFAYERSKNMSNQTVVTKLHNGLLESTNHAKAALEFHFRDRLQDEAATLKN